MPAGDGTGPMGMGAMSGRAAGYCAGYGMPGFANPIGGRGMGRGFGWGRGMGRGMGWGGGRGWGRGMAWGRGRGWGGGGFGGMYGAPYAQPGYGAMPAAMPWAPQPNAEQELDMLRAEAANLERALGEIRSRVEELEGQKGE